MSGPVLGCQASDECVGEVWPDEDWCIFDTSVGSFELLLCEQHYEAWESGQWSPPTSPIAVVDLVLTHPVRHG